MKKFLTFSLAIILVFVALASFGNIIGLAISVAIVYWSLKKFLKSNSFGGKMLWAIIGIVGLSITFSNLPALAGILAIYLLYVGYKHWKSDETPSNRTSGNPFENFDQQWNDIKNKH